MLTSNIESYRQEVPPVDEFMSIFRIFVFLWATVSSGKTAPDFPNAAYNILDFRRILEDDRWK